MLMRHNEHGWHNVSLSEVEEMKKNGWMESSVEEHSKVVAAKYKKAPEEIKDVTIEPQQEAVKGKPGRKPPRLLSRRHLWQQFKARLIVY